VVKFSDVEMKSCVLFGVWRGCLVSMAGGVAVHCCEVRLH
jgi:hypothetical protein